MIQVDLITGFLGAGKTTFLLKYARYLQRKGLRLGIIEYDFGAINVDMMLVGQLRNSNCEIEMVAAGCDMDCLVRRLKTKLIAMAMSGFDRVIIEPSGVFEMDIFYDMLREEPLENWYEIGSVITVIDGTGIGERTDSEEYVLATQAMSAGAIAISKSQLATESELEQLHKFLAKHSITCEVIDKNWDDFVDNDFDQFANCGYRIGNYNKAFTDISEEFESVSFLKISGSVEAFVAKVRELFADASYGDILRVKGFINEAGTNYQINATPTNIEVTKSPGQNVAIVIGRKLNEAKIKGLME